MDHIGLFKIIFIRYVRMQKKKKTLRKNSTEKFKYERTMNTIPWPLGIKWPLTDQHALKWIS